MTAQKKFVSPVPLPTDREREILIILMEEAAEIIYAASKAIRFGFLDVQPGQGLTNKTRLSQEIGDLLGIMDLGVEEGVFRGDAINDKRRVKQSKLAKFMQTEPDEASES